MKFSVSILKVSGLVLALKAAGLCHKSWDFEYWKDMAEPNFCNSTSFTLLYLQVRNNQNKSENVRNLKKFKVWSGKNIFWKISKKSQILNSQVQCWSSSLQSLYWNLWWSLSFNVLTRLWSRPVVLNLYTHSFPLTFHKTFSYPLSAIKSNW